MRTAPAVGSIRRVRQRISVDLPLPDSPMTTKTSPGGDVEVDLAHGDDVAGAGLQLAAGKVGGRRPDDALRARPEHLPQPPHGDRARALVPHDPSLG